MSTLSRHNADGRPRPGTVLLLLAALAVPFPLAAQDRDLVFDVGPDGSPVAEGAVFVGPADAYTDARGYGWVGSVVGPETSKAHAGDPLWGDGLVGGGPHRREGEPGLGLRARVPPGRYAVIVGAGVGTGDVRHSEVFLNGRLIIDEPDATLETGGATTESLYRFIADIRPEDNPVTVWVNRHGLKWGDPNRSSLLGVGFHVLDRRRFRRDGAGLAPADGWTPDAAFRAGDAALRTGNWAEASARFGAVDHPDGQAARGELFLWLAGDVRNADPLEDVETALGRLREAPADRPAPGLANRLRLAERFRDALLRLRAFHYQHLPHATARWGRFETALNGLRLNAADPDDPLAAQAALHAAAYYWNRFAETPRSSYLHHVNTLARQVLRAVPDCAEARMLLGEPVEAPANDAPSAGAPAWASAQRAAMLRLRDIVRHWAGRQGPWGDFGGGLDDDVELIAKSWWPCLFGAADPVARAANARFCEALWRSPKIDADAGYQRAPGDAEHAEEVTSETLPALLLGDPANATYRTWAAHQLRTAREVWTARDARGRLRFKSMFFGAREMWSGRHGVDVPFNVRAVLPAMWHTLLTGDPDGRAFFTAYADAWRASIEEDADGKPAWIIPAAVAFPEGTPRGHDGDWTDPQLGPDYLLGRGAGYVPDLLLFAWMLTGRETYLEPFDRWAEMWRRFLDVPHPDRTNKGTLAWAADRMLRPDFFAGYRHVTGRDRFDDILRRHGSPYDRWRIDGDDAALAAAYRDLARELGTNVPLKTNLLLYTDRCFAKAALLFGTQCGGTGDTRTLSLPGALWEDTGYDVAMLVREAGPDRFAADLHNFADGAKRIGVRLPRLAPGTVQVKRTPEGGAEESRIEFTGPAQVVRVDLPPGGPWRVTIEKAMIKDK